jgi:hypothetical protein
MHVTPTTVLSPHSHFTLQYETRDLFPLIFVGYLNPVFIIWHVTFKSVLSVSNPTYPNPICTLHLSERQSCFLFFCSFSFSRNFFNGKWHFGRRLCCYIEVKLEEAVKLLDHLEWSTLSHLTHSNQESVWMLWRKGNRHVFAVNLTVITRLHTSWSSH